MTPVGSNLRQQSVNSYTFVYGAIILALLSHLSSPKIFHYFPETSIRDTAAGVGTIREIQDFTTDGGVQVLQDVVIRGSVREKLDLLDEDNGTVSVTSVSSKNKTIASVVKQCQVNLDLYEISAPKVRKWDVPIKQKDADGATHLEIVECYYIGFTLVPKSSIRIIAPIVASVKVQRSCQELLYHNYGWMRSGIRVGFRVGFLRHNGQSSLPTRKSDIGRTTLPMRSIHSMTAMRWTLRCRSHGRSILIQSLYCFLTS